MTALSAFARELLDGRHHPVVSTLNADGSPQQTVVWVKRDGDDILFSTLRGRQKEKNLARDPRIGLLVMDPANPYHFVEVRGTARVTPDPASLINELSQAYTGKDWPAEPADTQRMVVRITPTRVVEHR